MNAKPQKQSKGMGRGRERKVASEKWNLN